MVTSLLGLLLLQIGLTSGESPSSEVVGGRGQQHRRVEVTFGRFPEAASENGGGSPYGGGGGGAGPSVDPEFERHVNSLRSTMFYVCQGSCLCGTVNNRGKVIYCYGDLVPRHGELFEGNDEGGGGTTTKDLIAIQLAVWIVGLLLLLIVLLLIRKSIASMRHHVERMTDRLPVYHDDDVLSTNSASSPARQSGSGGGASGGAKDTPVDGLSSGGVGGGGHAHPNGGHAHAHSMIEAADMLPVPASPHSLHHQDMFSEDGTLTPDGHGEYGEEPIHIGMTRLAVGTTKGVPVEQLKKMRLQRKDYKKGGEGLRGKNVTENFRVKEKDIKRTMK